MKPPYIPTHVTSSSHTCHVRDSCSCSLLPTHRTSCVASRVTHPFPHPFVTSHMVMASRGSTKTSYLVARRSRDAHACHPPRSAHALPSKRHPPPLLLLSVLSVLSSWGGRCRFTHTYTHIYLRTLTQLSLSRADGATMGPTEWRRHSAEASA